jgi:ABC-2 type transport system permease protein
VRADIARLDLSLRRRATVWYALGMAIYVVAIAALYPQFKDSASLNDLTKNNPAALALFGVSGSLTSPAGWLNANIYGNFFPLVMLLLTIGYGAAAIAGQDEDGTLSMVAVLPIRRTAIVAQKGLAMVVQACPLTVAVVVGVLLGRVFELTVSIPNTASVSVAVLVMGVDFGLVTLAVGGVTGTRGSAIAVGSVLAVISYLISSLAPAVAWIRPVRAASLFYWCIGNDQISSGVSVAGYTVLIVTGFVALAAAMATFERLDLH